MSEESAKPFVPRGRWGRLVKLGTTAASVGSHMVGRALGGTQDRAEDARRVAQALSELKGAAMKVGQLASMTPGLLPDEVTEALASLRSDGRAMDEASVRKVVEAELGGILEDHFERFDWTPVGSASVGQVHRAALATGEVVAVKVQFPGIADSMDADLDNVWALLKVARFLREPERLRAGLEELRRGLREELDYEREAEHLRTYAVQVMDRHDGVVVPTPRPELSTSRVLTMSYLDGLPLDVALKSSPADERDRLATLLVDVVVTMFHEQLFLHADPHPGNYLRLADGRLGILDWGCVRAWEASFADGWLKGFGALVREDREALVAEMAALGFDPDVVSPEQLEAVARVVAEPFLTPGPFRWGPWNPKPALQGWLRENMGVLRGTVPPEALFYFRTAAGIWGLLQQSGARVNVHELVHRVARVRGLSTTRGGSVGVDAR